ncbi:uncharacterized protein F4822DRAFT_263307 [Hypoxylon trugodes]|uniref:uncharacterized protein n=1 Tax=Hypoxylon trugodes TaxID=326681 RepID=UPI002199E213|nr:uncharacterized protein F4822DRAFT_263307 [Hypoxylon trugodes]KAI1388952.1 hypothetical protein F4822DRAFT_263307 [Hypoxylon trugodes]
MDRPRRALRSNPSRAAKVKRPVRETRSTVAYFSSPPSSSDDDLDDDSSDSDHSLIQSTYSAKRKRKNDNDDYSPRLSKVTRRSTRNSTRDVAQSPSRTARTTRTTHAIHTPSSTADTPISTSTDTPTVFPPWSTLPYHVLKCLFDQVAAPIRDPSSRREDVYEAVNDLMSAARTCKSFCEPALANLYKCPPFYHPWRYTKDPFTSFSQFLDALNMCPDITIIKYRPKVENLQIEVGSTLTQKFNANYLALRNVIPNLPRLSCLELYHEFDEPPYRKLDETIRFKCEKDDLVEALGGNRADDKTVRIELTSWRWNSRLMSQKSLPLDKLEGFHMNPSFASLRKIAFVNYQDASWRLPARLHASEEVQRKSQAYMAQLASCISALPKLEHLILETSTLVNGALLNRLPNSLKHLELINCWELIASDLTSFLLSHGSQLQSLTINHCQSLSLSFLPVLRAGCPKLEHLYMDLSYYKHHEHYADNKPEYETLLAEDEVPTWPSSIQSIEIFHMRKWGRKAAEAFFGSLVQSAPDLPHLRRLAFRVALDISWRQRQELREFWVDKMVGVFKRRAATPKNAKTLRPHPTEPRQQVQQESRVKPNSPAALPSRRSTRIANISPALTSSEGETAYAKTTYVSKAQLVKASAISKELKRLRGSGLLLKEQDADDEDSEDELAADHSDASQLDRRVRKISKYLPDGGEFIHGMCDVVDIQVDNHRPMERRFDMDDFLDESEDSDPEWDGGDVDVFD